MHISSMPLPLEPGDDEFIWGLTGNGKLTMKSLSDLQTANVASHTYSKLLTCLWKLNLPPKVKIFSWLLICQRLKIRQQLHTFTNSILTSCVFCTNHDESLDRLFMQCAFSRSIWSIAALPSSPIH